MSASNHPLVPSLAILAALISQNVGAAFAKNLFPAVGSEGVTALRVGISALLLLAWWRPWRTRVHRADALNLLVYGLTLGCMNLLIYRAFNLIPIGVAIAIEVTGPLVVVLLASRKPKDFLWIGAAVAGLALLLPIRQGVAALDPVGVAYAVGAAVCWAFYIVFGKRASTLQGGDAVAWGMLAAAVFTVPVGIAYAGPALLSPAVLLTGLAVAVLSSAAPYTLEMMALRRLPQRVFGMLVSSAPAVGALAGFAILGERLSWTQWAAIILIMVASAGSAATAGNAKAPA